MKWLDFGNLELVEDALASSNIFHFAKNVTFFSSLAEFGIEKLLEDVITLVAKEDPKAFGDYEVANEIAKSEEQLYAAVKELAPP